jgi:hypothetical protein
MADAHLLCSLSSELRYLCRASLQHASPQQKQSYGTTNKVITIFTKMGDQDFFRFSELKNKGLSFEGTNTLTI